MISHGSHCCEEDHHRHRPGDRLVCFPSLFNFDFHVFLVLTRPIASRRRDGHFCGITVAGGGGNWTHYHLRQRLYDSRHQKCTAFGKTLIDVPCENICTHVCALPLCVYGLIFGVLCNQSVNGLAGGCRED